MLSRKRKNEASIKEWSGKEWIEMGTAPFDFNSKELEIGIDKKAIGISTKAEFYFKWADNPDGLNDITTFFMNGDTAPDRRFKYYFKE